MKHLLCTALATAFITTAVAQDKTDILPKPRKNEIGILAEPGAADKYYGSPSGIQYKRWARPNVGYHVSATTGNYRYDNGKYYDTKLGDSLYFRQSSTFVPMHYLGAGVQVQKKFWGKLYLYAAVETRLGYGRGDINEWRTREVYVADTPLTRLFNTETVARTKLSIWVLDTTPFIGARMAFKWFTVGAEIAAVQYGVASIKYDNPMWAEGSTPMFDFGQLRQRFYLSYRF